MNSLKYKFAKNNTLVLLITTALVAILAVLLLLFFRIEYSKNPETVRLLEKIFLLKQNDDESLLMHVYLGIFISISTMLFISTALSIKLANSLLKSLKELKSASARILAGDLDFDIMIPPEKEIAEICDDLEQIRVKLKKKAEVDYRISEDRNMIMASLSHDMKTPITVIKGYLEGIRDGLADDPKTLKRYLSIIHSKSKLLESLAENMSEYSELELGRMHFAFKYLSFSELIESFCRSWRMEMNEQNRILLEHITENELLIVGDEIKLKRVFDNLINNAIKYSKEGSEILVNLEEAENGALLVVSDNGKGIKTEDLSKVFDGFYRGDAARTNVRGNGLGLAISKQIIENHHGKIWIRSEQDVGTQVYIYIPSRKGGNSDENIDS